LPELSRRRAFPLVARHRVTGVAYGTERSQRRGQGAEIAGSRNYRPGDRLAWIDWHASARLSLARNEDAFVVRQYYAELAPRVIIVVDRRPSMALYPAGLPWISKRDVLREAVTAIVAAAQSARAYVGYLDFSAGSHQRGAARHWVAPHRQSARRILHRLDDEFDAPADSLEASIDHLLGLGRDVPAGSFVFVLSDYLQTPSDRIWSRASDRRWELVPVIIQDPIWEQSFPPIHGLLVPVADPASGRTRSVRMTRDEASERRHSNETRLQKLIRRFQTFRFDPVVLDSADPIRVDLAFIRWATRRRLIRGRSR
jgi:uncharacterized protein (DUF58 family)